MPLLLLLLLLPLCCLLDVCCTDLFIEQPDLCVYLVNNRTDILLDWTDRQMEYCILNRYTFFLFHANLICSDFLIHLFALPIHAKVCPKMTLLKQQNLLKWSQNGKFSSLWSRLSMIMVFGPQNTIGTLGTYPNAPPPRPLPPRWPPRRRRRCRLTPRWPC